MALNIGELVATLDADDTGMLRGLTAAELAMAGFERDATGRLRRVNGEYVSTGVAARELGRHALQGATQARLAAAGLQRDAGGRLRDMRGRYVAAGAAAERMGQQMLLGSDIARGGIRRVGEDAERHLGRGLLRILRSAGAGLGRLRGPLGGLASGLGTVAVKIGGVGASLVPVLTGLGSIAPLAAGAASTLLAVAPAAAVAVTGILAAVTASQTLKLATKGVGDAITAAFDPSKTAQYNEALKKLAPNARSFVRAIAGIRQPLHQLQQSVQNRVFAGLGRDFKDLAKSALPPVRSALLSTAGTFNGMAQGVLETATALADDGTLGKALSGATKGLSHFAGIPGQIVNSLLELGAAAAPAFDRLAASAAKGLGGVMDRLDKAFQSGALSGAINTAVSLIKQIGGTLKNVGVIIGNVFKAASSAGTGALGPLSQIIGLLAQLSGTAAFQQLLGGIFGVMADLAKTALPLLSAAMKVLAPVIATLAPPVMRLIDALGAGLQPIITALGPVLLAAAGAIGALLDAVDPLLPIVGQMIASLGPVLTPILNIIGTLFGALAGPLAELGKVLLPPLVKLTGTLAGVFQDLAPVVADALDQLGSNGLMPVIDALGTVISEIVTGYADQFVSLFQQLLPVIPVLVPVVVQLAQSIAQILMAVAPLVPQLAAMSIQLTSQLLPALLPLLPPLADLTTGLLLLATWAITKIVIPAMQSFISFMTGMQKALSPAIDVIKWLVTGIAGLFEWLYDHLVGHSVIPDMVREIVRWLAGLPGKALSALASLPGAIAGVAERAASRMIAAIRSGVSQAVGWVKGLPGRARSALGNLGGYLYSAGQALIRGFINGIKSMAGAAGSAASSVLGKVKDFFPNSPAKRGPFSGRGWTLYSGLAVARDFAAGLTQSHALAAGAAAGLMGAAAGGLGLGGSGYRPATAGAAFGAVGAPAGGTVRVVLDVTGAKDKFGSAIAHMVRTDYGGDVQKAFGKKR